MLAPQNKRAVITGQPWSTDGPQKPLENLVKSVRRDIDERWELLVLRVFIIPQHFS